MRWRSIAGAVVAGGLALLGPRAAAIAEPGDAGAGAIALRPGPDALLDDAGRGLAVTAQPGGGVWQSVLVENNGAATETVHLAGSGEAGAWVQPAAGTVVLGPDDSQTVSLGIAPPRDATAGKVTATIEATTDGGDRSALRVSIEVLDGPPAAAAPAPPGGQAAGSGESGDSRESGGTRGRVAPSTSDPGPSDALALSVTLGVLGFLALTAAAVPALRGLRSLARKRRAARTERAECPAPPPRKRRMRAERGERPARRREVASTLRAAAGRLAALRHARPRPPAQPLPQRTAARPAADPQPDVLPETPPEVVRRVAAQRSAAAQRAGMRSEHDNRRLQARRAAAAEWERTAREARERSAREAAERARGLARAAAARRALAEGLAEARREEEEQRLEARRHAEAALREDAARRAHERAIEAARRIGTRDQAVRAAVDSVHEAEASRRAVADRLRRSLLDVQTGVARKLATTPQEPPLAGDRVAPLPFEGDVPDRFLRVRLPDPQPPRESAPSTGDAPSGTRRSRRGPTARSDTKGADESVEGTTDGAGTDRAESGSEAVARGRRRRPERVSVTALNLEALNRALSGPGRPGYDAAAAPSQGTRGASDHSRSSP